MLAGMGKRDNDLESDAELWARVARSARPLKKGTAGTATPKHRTKSTVAEAPPAKPAPRPVAKPAPAPRGERLDRQTSRRLERGHVAVEARLDLHGMRQKEAHAGLRKFLKWAVAKDYRHVLVITGKGAPADDRRPFYESEERGVLRASVPHWLSQSDLAHIVLSYAEAPRRLGGEGALYVRLRRPRSTK
jgi:DNA-nicking Smr family endonuclease